MSEENEKTINQEGLDTLGNDIDTSWIDPNKKLLAFTFDDGPVKWSEDSTAMRILKTLKEYGQHATFFYIGQEIDSNNAKEILFAKEIGCELANHTWTHPDLTKLTQAQVREEVDKTSDALRNVTGQDPFLFRIPFLISNDEVLETVNAPCISCSVDSQDYLKEATKESIIGRIMDAHEQGTLANSIVLLHEPYEKTQAAVAEIMPKLLEEGYQFVTVSELAKMNGVDLEARMVYTNIEKYK